MTPSSTRHKIKWKQIYYRQKKSGGTKGTTQNIFITAEFQFQLHKIFWPRIGPDLVNKIIK